MRRLILAVAILAGLTLGYYYPPLDASRLYVYPYWATNPRADVTHYPWRGYFALFGEDSIAGSLRIFNREATGKGLMTRLITAEGRDTMRFDSLGLYTTGVLNARAAYDGPIQDTVTRLATMQFVRDSGGGGGGSVDSIYGGTFMIGEWLHSGDTADVDTSKTWPHAVDTQARDTASTALSTANGKLDTNGVAANSKLLQGKDTTALWNAKTISSKDTAALRVMYGSAADDAPTITGKDTGNLRTMYGSAYDSATVAANSWKLCNKDTSSSGLRGMYGSAYDSATVAAKAYQHVPRTCDSTSTATPTPNAGLIDQYDLTALATNPTFAVPAGTPANGQKLIIRITANGSAHTIGWNAIYTSVGATLPTSISASKTIYVGLIYNSTASKWQCVAVSTEA